MEKLINCLSPPLLHNCSNIATCPRHSCFLDLEFDTESIEASANMDSPSSLSMKPQPLPPKVPQTFSSQALPVDFHQRCKDVHPFSDVKKQKLVPAKVRQMLLYSSLLRAVQILEITLAATKITGLLPRNGASLGSRLQYQQHLLFQPLKEKLRNQMELVTRWASSQYAIYILD